MECSICLESLLDSKQLSCGHSFHEPCIDPWLQTNGSCPNCRFQECPAPSDSDSDSDSELLDLYSRIRDSWIGHRLWEPAFWSTIQQTVPAREQIPPDTESFQTLSILADSQVSNITETETQYCCEIAGQPYQALKADINIVVSQTEESVSRCLFFFHRNDGDIVNTIMEMC
jgi:hypothetical protein